MFAYKVAPYFIFLVRFRLESGRLWERAAHSFDHMQSLLLVILVTSRFVLMADFGFRLRQYLVFAYVLL